MPKSYRIRTEVGKDKSIKVQLEQDFESLEILSLKILQSDIYNRVCADYGVVIGRITANNGLGLPNCKVSVFIPLTTEDEENPVISELYPYKTSVEQWNQLINQSSSKVGEMYNVIDLYGLLTSPDDFVYDIEPSESASDKIAYLIYLTR